MIRLDSKNDFSTSCDNSKSKKSQVSVFFTECPNLIDSFFRVRNEIYANENGYDHEKWCRGKVMDESDIIVVTRGDEVIGGAKISFSESGMLLSDEYEDTEFVYSNLLKKSNLECVNNYCQIDDLIVSREMRDGSVVKEIANMCVERASSTDCKYIFFVASLPQCRLYKSYFREVGCKNVEIFKEVIWKKVPEYNYSEDHPALVII